MAVLIDELALSQVCKHARRGYPHEVVGLLAGNRQSQEITHVEPLANERSDSPENRYLVSGWTLHQAEQALNTRGLEVVGYYHSHPDHPAEVSATDLELALPNMKYLIASVMGGRVTDTRVFSLAEDRSRMVPVELRVNTNRLSQP